MNKLVSFYHNDMDGKASGYCVYEYFSRPWSIGGNLNNYIMKTYDDPFKMDIIDKDTIVFISDLSFTKATFKDLVEICNRAEYVVWIDHHQSSKELIESNVEGFNKLTNLISLVSMDACGALLTYALSNMPKDSIFASAGKPNMIKFHYDGANQRCKISISDTVLNFSNFIFIPLWLFYIDDYDRFVHSSPYSSLFILGCDQNDTTLIRKENIEGNLVPHINEFWCDLSTNTKYTDEYITNGKIIMSYLESRYAREAVSLFEFTLPDGTTLICKNAKGNSWNFGKEYYKYPAVCIFSYDGKSGLWKHSIYARENGKYFNSAKFAETFGGGGHAGAAGFSLKYPIFTDKELYDKALNEFNA